MTAQCKPQGKQITFGDGDAVPQYNYQSAMREMQTNKVQIVEETPEHAFTKFYKTLVKTINDKMDAQNKIIKEQGNYMREVDVKPTIPINEELYVKAMSGFAKIYGAKPQLNDANTAISNHIINEVGIPKSAWYQFNQPYDNLKTLMKSSVEFMKDELIKITKLAK